jgi:hypothetical protein
MDDDEVLWGATAVQKDPASNKDRQSKSEESSPPDGEGLHDRCSEDINQAHDAKQEAINQCALSRCPWSLEPGMATKETNAEQHPDSSGQHMKNEAPVLQLACVTSFLRYLSGLFVHYRR